MTTGASVSYVVLVPGQRHFVCAPLRATVSTTACAARWKVAPSGTTCSGCLVGRQHAAETGTAPPRQAAPGSAPKSCARCGRTDLRIIRTSQLCVSCQNRTYEWVKGKNAKNKPPETFEPLAMRVVGVQGTDGATTWHAHQHRHAAEALTFGVRKLLPPGAKFSATRPGEPHWSGADGRFLVRCTGCSTPGLLERASERTGSLKYHCPACSGTPPGTGWTLASPRPGLAIFEPENAAIWMAMTGEPPGPAWHPTGIVCAECGAGQLEARQHAGQVQCRCPACGTTGSTPERTQCGSGGAA
jgi:hypothetical protein